MRNRIFMILFSGLVCCGPALAFGTDPEQSDWPAFRGPNRDGKTNQKLPVTWSQTEHVTWRTELPGSGWSSPVIVGTSIYVTAAVPTAQPPNDTQESLAYDLVLLRVSAESGQLQQKLVLFKQGKGSPRIHKKNSHASPTPVFDGQRLFIHFGHQGTACVAPGAPDQIVWKNDSLAYAPVHGNGGSPAVVGELLIFSRDGGDIGEVVALSKATGEVVWRRAREVEAKRQFSFCTPLVLGEAGRTQLILPGSNVVQSLDPATGEELWRVRYEGYSVIPRPIYESGLVFVCTGYDRPSILAIDPTGSGDVTETHLKWQSKEAIPHTPSLIGHAGRVTMVSDRGIASCFDAVSGKQLWKERIGGNFSASPLLVGETAYLLSEEGVCTLLDISADKPVEIAVNKLEERCLASPAVLDGDLILRSANALYRIGS